MSLLVRFPEHWLLCSRAAKVKVPFEVENLSLTAWTELFDAAWSVLDVAIRQSVEESTEVSPLVPAVLKTFQTNFISADAKLHEVSTSLIRDVLRSSISRFESIIHAGGLVEAAQSQLHSLVAILDPFADDIFADEELATVRVINILPKLFTLPFSLQGHRQRLFGAFLSTAQGVHPHSPCLSLEAQG